MLFGKGLRYSLLGFEMIYMRLAISTLRFI